MSFPTPSEVSKGRHATGMVFSVLVVLFLTFDGITKVLQVAPVIEACRKLGLRPGTTVGIGVLLLVCTVLYATPRTAILGAILLTGYLGGAAATHLVQGSGAFPTGFAVAFGLLAWAGLGLRDPRLVRWILLRQ